MKVMLLCPRKERKLLELHGDMIEHGQPVMGIFHRPRAESELLSEQGFDPRSASFQFVDISSADLGPWMQQLVTQEGWKRGSIEIAPVPYAMNIPNQRPFENHSIICFRHPEVSTLERYNLPYPINAIPGKAFVSLPRRQAAELARQQAEILGVGLAKKEPEIVEVPVFDSIPEPVNEMESSFVTEMIPEVDEIVVPLPGAKPEPIEEEETKELALPEIVVIEEDMPEIEREFRTIIQELLDAGVDPSDMMSDSRLEEIQERAMAIGFETWPVFMHMVT
jgi:hypothetical protein